MSYQLRALSRFLTIADGQVSWADGTTLRTVRAATEGYGALADALVALWLATH